MRRTVLAVFTVVTGACATAPVVPPSDIADLEPGTYELSASVPVRDDTEFQVRTETLVVEAQLSVDASGQVGLVADTGPCDETDPPHSVRRHRGGRSRG